MTRYAIGPDVAYRVIDGHVFIITPDNRQHELAGGVELCVWRLCEAGPRTEYELVRAIMADFEVDAADAQADLRGFLGEMVQAGVLIHVP